MRIPNSFIFEGAPGWSLQCLLWIASRVRECIPDLSVSVFLVGGDPPINSDDPQVVYSHRALFAEVRQKLKAPWITVHERRATAEDYAHAAIWCYPTHLVEDGAVEMARLAQANGAIPIFNPVGILAQKVFAGIPIFGIPSLHPVAKCRYIYEAIALLANAAKQEEIRVPMMERSRDIPLDETEVIVSGAVKIEGWMSEQELRWLANVARASESVTEIGCWRGRSTFALLSACKGTVTAVDHWEGGKHEPSHIQEEARKEDLHAAFLSNVGHFSNLRVIKAASVDAAPKVQESDVIFIDGGHAYDEVRADIRAWRPKARRLLAGHDHDWPEVARAVKDELGPVEHGPGSIWFFVVEQEVANAA